MSTMGPVLSSTSSVYDGSVADRLRVARGLPWLFLFFCPTSAGVNVNAIFVSSCVSHPTSGTSSTRMGGMGRAGQSGREEWWMVGGYITTPEPGLKSRDIMPACLPHTHNYASHIQCSAKGHNFIPIPETEATAQTSPFPKAPRRGKAPERRRESRVADKPAHGERSDG